MQAAEKEVRGEVSGILREGKAASTELAAAEAAADKAVSGARQQRQLHSCCGGVAVDKCNKRGCGGSSRQGVEWWREQPTVAQLAYNVLALDTCNSGSMASSDHSSAMGFYPCSLWQRPQDAECALLTKHSHICEPHSRKPSELTLQ
jgi:hypothetical protein